MYITTCKPGCTCRASHCNGSPVDARMTANGYSRASAFSEAIW